MLMYACHAAVTFEHQHPLPSLPRNTYITNRAFYLLCSAPPGYCCRWFWSGTLAFDIVCLISRDKCSFRQNVDSGWFHWIQKNEEQNGKEWKTKNKEQQQQPTIIQRFNCFLNVYSDIIHYKRWYEQVLWTWRLKKNSHNNNNRIVYVDGANNLRLTSITSTLLFGGIKFVLLAMQTKRAFTCCRPIFGYDKWFTVTPSGRCSNDSSMTVLSKYHVTFGRGRP